MTEGMYAGLISFTYNVGPRNLRLSTLRRMINRGDAVDAAEQFLRWVYDMRRNKLAGLLSRRRDERAVYLSDIHMLK
jgi:lysozyme